MGLPISSVMVRANSALRPRRMLAAFCMCWVRVAKGTSRHAPNARCAVARARSTSAAVGAVKVSRTWPVAGLIDWMLMGLPPP